jgi:RNA polymerase sigma factor (sigma-70 family)
MPKLPMPHLPEGRAARASRSAAAPEIYDRYADQVYDFCWALLRDPARAAEATERAFVTAIDQMDQVRDMASLRPWLYSVAHRQVLALARHNGDRTGELNGDGEGEGAAAKLVDPLPIAEALDPSPIEEAQPMSPDGESQGASDQDVEREVVWRAAAGLPGRDQALLTLHLRHGLDQAELGQALGVDGDKVKMLVSQLSDRLGRSLGALIVGRRARRDCAELANLLAEPEPRSTLVSNRLTRHVERCETCAKHRAGVEPLALLAAAPLVPAPPDLRQRVLRRIAPGGDRGRPRLRRPRGQQAWLLAAAFALVAMGGIVWSISRVPGGTPTPLGADPSRPAQLGVGPAASTPSTSQPDRSTTTGTSTTTSTSEPTSTATAAAPVGLTVSPEVVDLGAGDQSATLTIHNAGTTAQSWQASSSAGWLAVAQSDGSLAPGASALVTLTADRTGVPEGEIRATAVVEAGGVRRQVAVNASVERDPKVSASVSPTRISTGSLCGPTTAKVTATVSDESALRGVVLEWGDPVARTAMSHQGGSWRADVGPIGSAQTLSWRVVATDARGNTGVATGTVRVDGCLLFG